MSIYNRRKKAILLDQSIQYIDPVDCHSAVGYTINTTDYGGFRCQVELSSCDRKITWEFDCSNKNDLARSRIKIARAIDMLQRFRDAFGKHGPAFLETNRRKGKKK